MIARHESQLQAAGMLAVSALTGAAVWIAEGPASGLRAGAILLAFTLLVVLGRRYSGTLEVMSGVGDERTKHLYMRACAFAGSVMAFVIPVWFFVTLLQGNGNETLSALGALFGVAFVGAVVVLSRRG